MRRSVPNWSKSSFWEKDEKTILAFELATVNYCHILQNYRTKDLMDNRSEKVAGFKLLWAIRRMPQRNELKTISVQNFWSTFSLLLMYIIFSYNKVTLLNFDFWLIEYQTSRSINVETLYLIFFRSNLLCTWIQTD